MPYLSDDEINDLVSRAVSKALCGRKEQLAAENAALASKSVSEDARTVASGADRESGGE